MAATVFAVVAGVAPLAFFCTGGVLLLARLRERKWSWGRAALVAAVGSSLLAVLAFGAVAHLFADGLAASQALAAAGAGAGEALFLTGLVASGARLVDRSDQKRRCEDEQA